MDSLAQHDVDCHFCFKRNDVRDYSLFRQSRTHKRMDHNFREIFKNRGGNLKRAEKEDTIELLLPDAFSLNSDDSPGTDTYEKEVLLRYPRLGPTCVRFLGLHRIHSKGLPPENFAMVAIGTMSNPYPEVWSSSGAFCEEHLEENCVPLKGGATFHSVDDFQSFSCEHCHLRQTVSSVSKLPVNVHKQVSKCASLKLMLFDEKPAQDEEICRHLDNNFYFRWKCAVFSETAISNSSLQQEKPNKVGDYHQLSFTKTDDQATTDNWISLLEKRFVHTCNSSPDLQLYSSEAMHYAIDLLKSKISGSPPPYLNPNFKDTLKSCILEAILRFLTQNQQSLKNPHWKALAGLHADIISTDLAHSFHQRNQHFLRLDQLKAGSGFIQCEAINKQLLLDCSQAQIMVAKVPKLNATFADENGKPQLPPIEIIGISDSWLYVAGDPYLRCDDCAFDSASDRRVVTINHKAASKKRFYTPEIWLNMRVKAVIDDFLYEFPIEVSGFVPGSGTEVNKVRLTQQLPQHKNSLVLFIEYPFHYLAGNLRVTFDTGDSSSKDPPPIMIMQALKGGDYAMPQPLPSPNLFTILAIFSNPPNDSPISSGVHFWKFRIGRIVCRDVPVFHHFWGKSPIFVRPWKNADHRPKGNSYCMVPPEGNYLFSGVDPARNLQVGRCYYYLDTPVDHKCSLDAAAAAAPPPIPIECKVCKHAPPVEGWVESRCNLVTDFIPLIDCVTDAGQSKWSLHFEMESDGSLARQGGVMFVYMPANLGKTQKHRPEVLGFVGTSSPVLSMDIIDREISSKTSFVNGFRETFESLLVSCMDGRIFVVNSPRVPVFESPSAPLCEDQKMLDQFRTVERLKNYIKNQLQDSSQQHALMNGCLIDYFLRVDSGSSGFKSVISSPGFLSPPDAASASFKCEDLVKYMQQSLSKSAAPRKPELVFQDAAASHKRTFLEQQLLRKIFVNVKVKAAIMKAIQQDSQKRQSLMQALSFEKDQIESKISKTFGMNLLEIYRLQHVKLAPLIPITPLTFMSFRPDCISRDNPYRNDFIEMNGVLQHVRNAVKLNLGCQ